MLAVKKQFSLGKKGQAVQHLHCLIAVATVIKTAEAFKWPVHLDWTKKKTQQKFM